MINGSIYIYTDPNAAFQTINNGAKLIIMSEDIPFDNNDPNLISGTCLLPPPIAKMAEIDGDAERFYQIYSEYLLSDVPVDFISVILGFIHQGGNISILANCNLDDTWLVHFMNHMMMYYGISIGTFMIPFSYNQQFDDCINGILYSSGIEQPYEYLANHTPGVPFPDHEIMQLQSQLNFVTQDPQRDFNNMAAALKVNPKLTSAVSFNPNMARREIL